MNKIKTALAGLTIFALNIPAAHAVVNADDMFGGTADDGTTFATTSGLGDAELVPMFGSIINTGLGFLGLIAVAIIIMGGFKWVTASGDDEKVKKARKYIYQGLIGLVIVLAAYAIAQFALSTAIGAMSTSDGGSGE
ncbi:MAG: hypothetical protein V1664_04990 [Candidatus Uhrbacteria bacterium]